MPTKASISTKGSKKNFTSKHHVHKHSPHNKKEERRTESRRIKKDVVYIASLPDKDNKVVCHPGKSLKYKSNIIQPVSFSYDRGSGGIMSGNQLLEMTLKKELKLGMKNIRVVHKEDFIDGQTKFYVFYVQNINLACATFEVHKCDLDALIESGGQLQIPGKGKCKVTLATSKVFQKVKILQKDKSKLSVAA